MSSTPTGQDPMKEAERLIQRVEAAGYRRGLERRAPSDHEPEIAEAIAAIRKLVEAQPAAVAGIPDWVLVNELVEQGQFYKSGEITEAQFISAVNHYVTQAAPAAPSVGEPPCPDGWVTQTLESIWAAQRGENITDDMKRAACIALKVCRGERWDDNAQDWTASPAAPAGVPTQPNSFHRSAADSSEASGSAIPARPTIPDAPIDMLLFCPACGLQHVDAPEASDVFRASMMQAAGVTENAPRAWTNPPHKSHLCHRCGHVWRPADVPTNGVLETKTRGANDSFTSMLGTPKTAASFDEFFDREYPNVEDRQGRFRNSNGYQLCWRGWEAATERAAAICRGVNNHDNPMTANDCADEIEKGLEP